MSPFDPINQDQIEFEDALRQLQPISSRLDPTRLMYQAGRDAALQEAHMRLRRWQVSTFVTSACALLAVTVLWSDFDTGSSSEHSVATHQIAEPHEQTESMTVSEHQPTEASIENSIPPTKETSSAEPVVQSNQQMENRPRSNVGQPTITLAWWNQFSSISENSDTSYFALRNRVLREGLDAFPDPDFSQEATSTGSPIQREPLSVRDGWDSELWNQI